jgi:hypothetical protein
MTTTKLFAGAALLALAAAACGPQYDPPSLIEAPRVLGARIEVAGAPDRAMPRPGESFTVTWLVSAPGDVPPLGWAFALCAPGRGGALACDGTPLAIYTGHENPPRLTITMPAGQPQGLVLYGRICAASEPIFDPASGYPACSNGGTGTTASLGIPVQTGAEQNHNPHAEASFTFDGQPWGPTRGADGCAGLAPVVAGSKDHVIAFASSGADREPYTTMAGDPPVPTAAREGLQISQFTTAGKLKSAFTFIDPDDARDSTPVAVKWTAPAADKVPAGAVVTLTFVARDGRGGVDWTTRMLCVR